MTALFFLHCYVSKFLSVFLLVLSRFLIFARFCHNCVEMKSLLKYSLVASFFFLSFSALFAQNITEKRGASVDFLPAYYSHHIDSMVNLCIDHKILPGCQIMAVHSDSVVFSKNYGYLTYDSLDAVNDATVYDVASMTKPLATTLAVMKLYDEHRLRLTDKLGQYLDYTSGTAVAELTLAELLTHTSGLSAFVPFYREISGKNFWDTTVLHTVADDRFSLKVADNVFLRNDYPDTLRYKISIYHIGQKKYVYSDLGFFLLKEVVESVVQRPMEDYLADEFYRPMGLHRTGFHPLEFVKDGNIAPTEDDKYFRKQVLKGYVHDQTAALFGGNGGNAGLFSTASEVSALLSMLMHGGVYNGRTYLSEKTVRQFVSTCPMHGCQRRGLGFDTPSFPAKSSVLPVQAGRRTYGHQGFTGTVFWCDPDADLIYIFLSNRVYPDMEPNRLSQSRLRLLVHEEIYKALGF